LVAGVRWFAWIGAVAVAVLSSLLIADGFLEMGRAAVEAERVEALEVRVLTEAAAAEELAKETELHTKRSVAREERNVRLGWGLLIATALFLASAKGYQALRFARQPALVTIGAHAGSAEVDSKLVAAKRQAPRAEKEEVDVGFVDSVIDTAGTNRESAIPILQALQTHFRYLPEDALRRVCETTQIDPAQIVGVASFYSQFRRDPVGRHLVRVCHGTACHVAGIEHIMDELRRRLEIPPDADTDPWHRFTLESVNCLGCCSLAPVLMVEEHVAGHLSPTSAWQELEAAEAEA
jgi:NADH:ubiquinone oxidoreductase subunit E